MTVPIQPDHSGLQQDFSGLEVAYRDADAPQVDLSKQADAQEKYLVDDHAGIVPPRRICGLSKRTFWILGAVVGVVVVAVAVGGGVGGSRSRDGSGGVGSSTSGLQSSTTTGTTSASSAIASSSTSALSSTTSPSPTTSSAIPFPTSGLLSLNCPTLNNTTYTSTPGASNTKYTYAITCNEDFPGNDIFIGNASTINQCLDRCAVWTDSNLSQPCEGVIFNANLTSSIAGEGGNCFLKKSTANGMLTNNGDGTVAAAVWNH